MKTDGDYPLVERSARGLGVRVSGRYADVHPDEEGIVHPGAGMSVAPDDPLLLDSHRRPSKFGGTGEDPVWMIHDTALLDDLRYLHQSTDHGVVEPAAPVLLTVYEDALAATRTQWTRA